jgi:hypothetical protein
MTEGKGHTGLKILTTLSFIIMVTVNALANILPINGMKTGEVSNAYPNLFAPAGITFLIWGVIYLLLAGYVLYQLGLFKKNSRLYESNLITYTSIYFSISSLANVLWIFAWHYRMIALSMILMLVILSCLIKIGAKLSQTHFSTKEYLLVRLPFSIYFGWITVATIANFTTLLVSLNWNQWGLAQQVWAVIIIAIGLLIAAAVILKNRDIAYSLAIIWAYAGIVFKHVSASGFNNQYPSIIITAVSCIILIVITDIYMVRKNKNILVEI